MGIDGTGLMDKTAEEIKAEKLVEAEHEQARKLGEAKGLLWQYNREQEAIDALKAQYAGVFEEIAGHAKTAAELEDKIKVIARETGEFETGEGIVLVVKKASRTINVDGLLELHPWLQHIPGAVQIVKIIDDKLVNGLVKTGQITEDELAGVTTVKPMTSAVTIKLKPKIAVAAGD